MILDRDERIAKRLIHLLHDSGALVPAGRGRYLGPKTPGSWSASRLTRKRAAISGTAKRSSRSLSAPPTSGVLRPRLARSRRAWQRQASFAQEAPSLAPSHTRPMPRCLEFACLTGVLQTRDVDIAQFKSVSLTVEGARQLEPLRKSDPGSFRSPYARSAERDLLQR
jgi:hypothetical protein